jgi:hypothetical protein
MRALQKRMLRKIELKREEVAGNWRKLHIDEIHDLYPHQIFLG